MENVISDTGCQPELTAEESTPVNGTTNSDSGDNEFLIPVKFNKEVKNITPEQAAGLAQKGMKYETIEQNYKSLLSLANQEGKSVQDYLELLRSQKIDHRKSELIDKCGGDKELAEHIIKLESGNSSGNDYGLEELKSQFSNIKSEADLPAKVVENAHLKGTKLLDEYLRYRLGYEKKADKAIRLQHNAELSSIGSQSTPTESVNPETAEFLKGLWK